MGKNLHGEITLPELGGKPLLFDFKGLGLERTRTPIPEQFKKDCRLFPREIEITFLPISLI